MPIVSQPPLSHTPFALGVSLLLPMRSFVGRVGHIPSARLEALQKAVQESLRSQVF